MEIYYTPIVIIALIYALYYYFTRTFNYWKERNVRGPETTVFFGNIKESALRQKNVGVLMQEIYDMFPDEKVVGLYRMTTPSLLIRDLDIIKNIMIRDFELFTDRGVEFSKKGFGENLFHADGDTWRALRSRFTPMFTTGKLKHMFPIMTERGDFFMKYVNKMAEKNPEFEVHSLIQKYTVSAVCSCAFGLELQTLENKFDDLELIEKLVLAPNFSFEIDMMYPGILKKLGYSAIPKEVQVFFNNLVQSVINIRGGKTSEHDDFMDFIIEMRQQGNIESPRFGDIKTSLEITDDVIAAQAFIFYVAGYETSATTVAYLLYQLALNQDIQDKVVAEVDEIANANDGEFTYETMKDLKYLHKVFDETLRLYSIVEPIQRRAEVDYKIPGTDITIEKGTIVLVSPRGIHHDEKYYPKPEVFDPDRFNADVAGERHPCAYLPFGVGQRNCIGMRVGRLQTTLCTSKILRKFRVVPSKNTNRNLGVDRNRILVGPQDGIYLNFIPRK
ncbi:cytochrome P450 6B2-like [Trichoplusia ni]|uniref:unspecific monooxygenase n=1 Tax=Trichoplusia ni TaxID=7111 RepID=A0A7E5WM62_TRINI|nr:cytochrome P450 6B2-like [Trichoplusia ni]